MKKILLFLSVLFLVTSFSLTQDYSKSQTLKKREFRPMFSAIAGMSLSQSNSTYSSTFAAALELDIHPGKGYYVGIGLLNFAIPQNKSNTATYLYVQVKKGFYLADNFAIYTGIGGTIGVTTKGHPGCCVGGVFISLSAVYELHRFIAAGINNRVITGTDETFILPGVQLTLRL
jgi:hypothetical protein